MLSVPFPVVTLLVLLFLLLTLFFSEKTYHKGTVYFILSCIVLLLFSTLRWEYHSNLLRDIQSFFAILQPPIIWCFFVSMILFDRSPRWIIIFFPAVVSLLIRVFFPQLTEVVIIFLFLIYGCGLFRVAFCKEYQLTLSRLGYSSSLKNMAFFSGFFLFISALTDSIITFDFSINSGKFSSNIVVASQVVLYPVFFYMVICSSKSSENVINEAKSKFSLKGGHDEIELSSIFKKVEAQVREKQIYLNPDLTLITLAKKTGIPARQLSSAINTVMCCNVSQWVNGLRIERAKELLRSTTLPVTDIMLESGFMTKSNFNREFQRIVGLSPTLFRRKHGSSVMSSEMK